MFRRLSPALVRSGSVVAMFALLAAVRPTAQSGQAVAADLPTARQVIDRHLKVIGGVDAYKAVQSIRATGTMSVPAQQMNGTLEMMAARPNRRLVRVNIPGIGAIEEGFDGKIAWSIDPISGPALVVGRELTERADDAWFDAPLHEPDFVTDMSVVGREEFDRRQAYRVSVRTKAVLEQFELFDVETGQQLGYEARRETPMGTVPIISTYRDYRKFGALTMAATISQRVLGMDQVMTFTAIEFDKVPATAFDLPPAIKALIK
jgi:hypothetical protein